MYRTNYSVGPQYFGTSTKKSWFDEGDRFAPGPGAHNPKRFDRTTPPVWTEGKSTSRDGFMEKHNRQYPSPDRYKSPNLDHTHLAQPKYSVPLHEQVQNPIKVDENNSLIYKPNYNGPKPKYPDYSFGYHFERDYSTKVPPPDSYNAQKVGKKDFNRTQKSFSISERPPPYGEEGRYPYVGKYNVSSDMGGSKFSIGESKRPEPLVGESPGKLLNTRGDIKQLTKGKTIGMVIQVPKNKDIEEFPSPVKYNPKLPQSARSIIDYKAKRSQLGNAAVAKYPSPQNYQPQPPQLNQTVSFTKHTREVSERNQNPGVGSYDVQKKLSSELGHMGMKLKKLTEDVYPAPSAYQPSEHLIRQTPQRPINYYSNRTDFSRSITGARVGPGVYETSRQSKSQYGKMGRGDKFPPNYNRNPGPGNYEIPSGIGKLPKYCAGPKKMTDTGLSVMELERQQRVKQIRAREQARQQAEEKAEEQRLAQQEEEAAEKMNQSRHQ